MMLADRLMSGDVRALARAISLVEDEDSAAADLVRAIFPKTGRATVIGVTGPPGAGKSTLVDRLTTAFRLEGQRVGIVAVDPTSPFSGGAVLGDRLRMQAHAGDDGVFIRSMATRGHLGGLARTTADVASLLDAAGKDIVLIETVGVGQDEVDIVRTADVSIVVLVPGTGDDVQAIKAGIMEIADLFVVNKADREGADRLISAVEANLSLHEYGPAEWRPPVIRATATTGAGVADIIDGVRRFLARPDPSRAGRRRQRSDVRLRELLGHRFFQHLERAVLETGEYQQWVERVAAREVDPYSAADALLARALGGAVPPPHAGTTR